MLPALRQTLAHKYHEPIFDYGNVDTSQAQRSWDSYAPYGWYGTNYVGLRGRMAILSEAYSHADFKTRVRVTHDFLVEILNYVARHGDEIRRLERAADRQTALEGAGSALRPSLAVAYQLATRGIEPVRLELRQQVGTYRLPVRDRFVDSLTRPLPAGYFLPAADRGVAALLRLHGIQVQRLTAEWTDTVEVLTGTELKWATREFQGHQLLEVTGTWARASRRVPAGGYFVSTAQPLGRLSAAEPTESPAAPGPPAPAGATKCLGDEPEAAQPTAAPPAGATLAGEGDADQLAQRAEEAHVGLLRTGLAAFLWLRRRASPRRPGRGWRGLARALHEPRGAERRSTATAAPTATTSTPSKPESVREPL